MGLDSIAAVFVMRSIQATAGEAVKNYLNRKAVKELVQLVAAAQAGAIEASDWANPLKRKAFVVIVVAAVVSASAAVGKGCRLELVSAARMDSISLAVAAPEQIAVQADSVATFPKHTVE